MVLYDWLLFWPASACSSWRDDRRRYPVAVEDPVTVVEDPVAVEDRIAYEDGIAVNDRVTIEDCVTIIVFIYLNYTVLPILLY